MDLVQRKLDACAHRSCASTDMNHRWFENVTLANRACGGGIVAWKGSDDSIAPGNRYGAYISNSEIIRVRTSIMRRQLVLMHIA